jgi:hypothetical protein
MKNRFSIFVAFEFALIQGFTKNIDIQLQSGPISKIAADDMENVFIRGSWTVCTSSDPTAPPQKRYTV